MLAEDSPRSGAASCKDRGNRRFAARDDAGALGFYTHGISLLSSLDSTAVPTCEAVVHATAELAAALHANAAQVLLRQKRWFEALEHCNGALKRNPAHTKAAWRGATAAIELGMHEVAVSFVENGLVQTPDCQELLELHQRLGPVRDIEFDDDAMGNDDNVGEFKYFLPKGRVPAPKKRVQPPGKEKGD